MKIINKIISLFAITIIASFSGCGEVQNDMNDKVINPVLEISFNELIDSFMGEQNTNLRIMSREANANNINIKFNSTQGIELVQDSFEIAYIDIDSEEVIEIPYRVLKPGNDEISFSITGENLNETIGKIIVNSKVGVPKYEIGEYWVFNQTYNGESNIITNEIVKVEETESIPCYVLKTVYRGDIKGNYLLDYFSVEDLSKIKREIIRSDEIEKEFSFVPPLVMLPFPFELKETWNYSGIMTGTGKINIDGVIQKIEERETSGGNFDSLFYKITMAMPLGTTQFQGYYSPEAKIQVYQKMTTIMGAEVTEEEELDLIEHGVPPKKVPELQIDIDIPENYKLYRNDNLRFLIESVFIYQMVKVSP